MNERSISSPLEYASQPQREPSERLYRIALVCGLAPMTLGLSILLLFWMTGAESFIAFGMLTLLAGSAAVIVGLVASTAYVRDAHRVTNDGKRSFRRGIISLILVLLNLPTAAVCVLFGAYLATTSVIATFVVQNDSSLSVDHGTLFQARHQVNFGSIPSGCSRTVRLRIESHGPINAEISRQGVIERATIAGDCDEDDFRGVGSLIIHVTNDRISAGG